MKNSHKVIILCILLMVIGIVAGFFIVSVGPSYVSLGIGVMYFTVIITGAIFFTVGMKIYNQKNQEKENRLKKLEDEVESLKNKLQ